MAVLLFRRLAVMRMTALQMAVSAMVRAGWLQTKLAVRDEIEKTSGYIGTGGVVNMSSKDHLGLDLVSIQVCWRSRTVTGLSLK